jgi:hypothetical protein
MVPFAQKFKKPKSDDAVRLRQLTIPGAPPQNEEEDHQWKPETDMEAMIMFR